MERLGGGGVAVVVVEGGDVAGGGEEDEEDEGIENGGSCAEEAGTGALCAEVEAKAATEETGLGLLVPLYSCRDV